MQVDSQPYEAPVLTDLGEVAEFALGEAAHDTADMDTARYY
ncbi:lasso RiPP family leader peptide-containing protein [Lentzea tibetensis]|uniref:Lasso RiPP family leader peptide-containing protein n=1 Tax=Lentzea tibetensis TaxID=2591470 RepID=A0A563EHH1_9PSEU|nr:lasso RiPP family leader peptide-containing protein [Lentzea tibetensis]TWP46077.1 lasso RiPP family leader peptide-containing protein [Lentzea tibetensis]